MLFSRKNLLGLSIILLVFAVAAVFVYNLSPVSATSQAPVTFEIKSGDGFRGTVSHLYAAGLIRSPLATEVYMLVSGRALELKPGLYKLSTSEWTSDITRTIAGAGMGEVQVTIPEGANVYQIDSVLSGALVIHPGDLVAFNKKITLEGQLFPDTYNFFTDANVSSVVQEFLTNFNAKAGPLLASDTKNADQDLILASIVEKEVPTQADQEIVAGILLKRLRAGMPLDIDATVCYAKLMAAAPMAASCPSLSAADFKLDSPYNTYLYKGLPPGPISNPGTQAITAVLHPQASLYWYYLSDPATGKTIFATTLAEQEANQRKYLKQ
ncbi:MAG TPA: endolytic transglycosylase MltG [Candidatus Paceibacterota bacterium]|nr:endolytic transglycosylase MltG [Candidatus Paceibacterota bacterium]